MQRVLKLASYIVGSAFLIILVSALALIIFVNPNDFKPTISQRFYQQTGQKLTIHGKISWRLYPGLGLAVHDITLGNPKGFKLPLANISEAILRIKLKPLFSKQIDISQIYLRGVSLHLIKHKNGKCNWQNLFMPTHKHGHEHKQITVKRNNQQTIPDNTTKKSTATPVVTKKKPNMPFAIHQWSIDHLQIQKANIYFHTPKEQFSIEQANLDADHVRLNQLFPLHIQLHYLHNQYNLPLELNTQVRVSLADHLIKLKQLNLKTRTPKAANTHPAHIHIQSTLSYHWQQQAIQIDTAKLQLANIQAALHGHLKISTPMQAKATLDVHPFQVAQLLKQLNLKLPTRLNPKAIKTLSAKITVRIHDKKLSLSHSQLILNQNPIHITGQYDLQRQSLQSTLTIQTLKIADLLKPANKTHASQQHRQQHVSQSNHLAPKQAAHHQRQKKTWLLGKSHGKLTINIQQLTLQKLKIDNISLTLNFSPYRLKVAPLLADFYNGKLHVTSTLDFHKDRPQIQIKEDLSGTQSQALYQLLAWQLHSSSPVLATMLLKLPIHGKTAFHMNLKTSGQTQAAWLRQVDGTIHFSFSGGTLSGLNADEYIQLALSQRQAQQIPTQIGDQQTMFSRLSGSIRLTHGIAHNNDFVMDTPTLIMRGNGQANLLSKQLNYQLNIKRKRDINKSAAFSIPLSIQGPLMHPRLRLDVAKLASNQLNAQKSKIKKSVTKKITTVIKDKIGTQAINALGKLF